MLSSLPMTNKNHSVWLSGIMMQLFIVLFLAFFQLLNTGHKSTHAWNEINGKTEAHAKWNSLVANNENI
jgi:hypothetical protein